MSLDIKFSKGAESELTFPLTSLPMNTGNSRLASPRVGINHGITCPINSENIEELFWEVMDARTQVSKGCFPHEFMEKYYPAMWGNYETTIPEPLHIERLSLSRPDGLANVVHMDSPVDVGLAMMTWVLRQGIKPKSLLTGHLDFLNAIPDMIAIMGVNVKSALDKAFDVKYYYGIARPEEVYASMSKLDNSETMTAYPEGCPTHPSYPAGHGAAAAGCAATIIGHYNMTPEQEKVIKDTAYHWAMYRTLAGVHYGIDNVAGLCVGGLLELNYFNNQYLSNLSL